MRIAVGSDHAGFELKEAVKGHLVRARQCEVVDVGASSEAQSVDYPDFAALVGGLVAAGDCELGVLVCGTGIGMSIAANKVRGVRAALVHDEFTARMAREHNAANILVLGGRLLSAHAGVRLVDAWLDATPDSRHQRRIDKLSALDVSRE